MSLIRLAAIGAPSPQPEWLKCYQGDHVISSLGSFVILASISSKDRSAPQGGRWPAASAGLFAKGEGTGNPASARGVAEPEGQIASPGRRTAVVGMYPHAEWDPTSSLVLQTTLEMHAGPDSCSSWGGYSRSRVRWDSWFCLFIHSTPAMAHACLLGARNSSRCLDIISEQTRQKSCITELVF